MIVAAAALCWNNVQEAKTADAASQTVLAAIKNSLPAEAAEPEAPVTTTALRLTEDLFAPYETTTVTQETAPADIVIDDSAYCGYLSIPALGLELPVRSDLSYPALKKSPCCFNGSALTNDFIIAAHNYPAHFGRIGNLVSGDQLIFTDTGGNVYEYIVAYTEIIAGTAPAQMFSGQAEEWDLTLFTCTLGGQSRVTVRANRVLEEETET